MSQLKNLTCYTGRFARTIFNASELVTLFGIVSNCYNIVPPLMLKNRRCKSSRVTPPLGSLSNHDGDGKENATLKVNSRGFKLHRY